MICERTVKKYCKNFEKIENYEAAIADTTQTWHCHHRMEEVFTTEELKRAGWYYDRKPQELIFLTKAEHIALHMKGKKRGPLSDEHRANMSAAKIGKKHSEEHKAKISAACKGKKKVKHWRLENGKRVWY